MCNTPAVERRHRGGVGGERRGVSLVTLQRRGTSFYLLAHRDKPLLCFLVSSITKITRASRGPRPLQE